MLLPTAPACVPEGRTVDSTTGGRPTTGVSTIQRICSIGKAPLAAGAVAAVGAMTGPSLQFGVLYGATLRQIGAAFRGHAALFGFDSFTGLPPEQVRSADRGGAPPTPHPHPHTLTHTHMLCVCLCASVCVCRPHPPQILISE